MNEPELNLGMVIGEVKGKLDSLIAHAENEHEENLLNRQIVNQSLAEIFRRLQNLPLTDERLSKVTERVDAIEPVIADYKKKLAVASAILGAGMAIAFEALKLFSTEIKHLIGLGKT